MTVRKYGSQGIAMCHHGIRSPRATMNRHTTPVATAPATAPAIRRGVARVKNATTTVRSR
jgi:hypothetical protein